MRALALTIAAAVALMAGSRLVAFGDGQASSTPAQAPAAEQAAVPTAATPAAEPDPIRQLVARLDLERYKATIKGLTAFGDRRQGTARNRAAIDWIEAQLESYGCTTTERLRYEYTPRRPGRRHLPHPAAAGRAGAAATPSRVFAARRASTTSRSCSRIRNSASSTRS
jgi:hypothetical protein